MFTITSWHSTVLWRRSQSAALLQKIVFGVEVGLYNNVVVLVVKVVVYFLGRQQQQPLQPCSCSRCYSCRVFFGDDNSNNLYNHAVVPVVIVFVFAIQIVCLHLHSKIIQRKNGPSCLDLSLKILKILAHRKSSTIFAFNKQNKS